MTIGPCLGTSRDRKAQTARVVDVFVARIREIAARDLSGTFEQVPNERRAPERGPCVRCPAELVNLGRDEQRRIGGASRDHDVRSAGQGLDDRLGPDVRVGGNERVLQRGHGLPGLRDHEVPRLYKIQHVVTGHGGDRQATNSKLPGDLSDNLRGRDRIRGPHVRDDRDLPLHADGQDRGHAIREHGIEARVWVEGLRLLSERDRSLCETFEHEVVEVTFGGELDCRLDPIAGESCAAADPKGHVVL
jgi:hypothetical protein